MIKTVGFVGMGLMGGAIAKSIKKYHVAEQIIAYNRNPDNLNRPSMRVLSTDRFSKSVKAFPSVTSSSFAARSTSTSKWRNNSLLT